MFWNSEFLNASPSHIDVLLQSQETKLSDILFEEDILQELKTSNVNLTNFLIKQETLTELVDNITNVTEEDCSEKSIYSRVHAAYVSCEILTACSSEIFDALLQNPDLLNKIISCLSLSDQKVVPQKATLVSKLISNLHSQAPADLSCHITKNVDVFSALIKKLVENIDISGSYEILSTFIKRTNPSDLRYVFCELLSKFNLVNDLINVMTSSEHEDKQRNACQLLCDIIVIGRQEEASEQAKDGPTAQDMLAEYMESRDTVAYMLGQPSSDTTGTLCIIKVLQVLVDKGQNMNISQTIEQIQDVLADNLIKFHELLLNPPKQEPIKTTFGVIQKPLGYMRLEVVNLIRALLSTNSPVIIQKLVELNTMKVIMELFIEFPWNNLLHTQVERALCLIIKNCRHDEDQRDMKDLSEENANEKADEIPSRALLSQLLNECDLIGRLLLPNRNDEQANFGHIIQIINSIAINCDLDTIQDHLNAMKDNRPELYDRWTKFVNVDVASFKEISLYCDVHSLNNHVEGRDKQHNYLNPQQNHHPLETLSNNNGSSSIDTSARIYNGEDRELMAYLSFTRESVLPSINVDVLPKSRRSTRDNNY